MTAWTKKAWLPVLAFLVTQSTPSAPQTAWVEARGARVPVPAGWSSNDRLIAAFGPIGLTNVGGVYSMVSYPRLTTTASSEFPSTSYSSAPPY